MKRCVVPTLQLSAVLAAILLLLGCKAESTRASQQTTSAPPAVVQASPIPPAPTNSVGARVVQPTPVEKLATAPAALSPGVKDVIDLAQSGVGNEVLLAFVANYSQPFKLSADEILYLTDLGIPEEVIAAMIKHHGKEGVAVASEAAKTAQPVTSAEPTTAAESRPAAPAQQPGLAGAGGAPAPSSNPGVSIQATPEFEAGVQPAPEAVPAPAPAPQAPVQYEYFYSSLSPYGTWIDVPGYGLCWRPTVAVVQPSWKPYSDRGRWLYTDYGWYWQSDYSWGWAAFHYGRWWSHPHHGWVWVPDDCWGPSWVTWRYSDVYCGWAPLPPGAYVRHGVGFTYYDRHVSVSFDFGLRPHYYTFVPITRFCDRTPWRYHLPATHVAHVYNRTKIVNNIQVINNNTIINNGIERDRVAAVARDEIRKVSVQDMPTAGESNARPERLEKRGAELVVYRPQLAAASSEMATQRAPSGRATLVPSSRTPATLMVADQTGVAPANPGPVTNPVSSRSELAGKPTLPDSPKLTDPAGAGARSVPSKSVEERRGPAVAQPQFNRSPVQSIPNQSRPALSGPATSYGSPAVGTGSIRSAAPAAHATTPRIASRPNAVTTWPNGAEAARAAQAPAAQAPKRVEQRTLVPASPGFRSELAASAAVRSRPAINESVPRPGTVPSVVNRAPSIGTVPSSQPGRVMTPPSGTVDMTPPPRRELPKAPSNYGNGFERPATVPTPQYHRPQPGIPSGEPVGRPTFRPAPQPNMNAPTPYQPSRPSIATVPSNRAPQSSPGYVQPHQMTPSPRSIPQPAAPPANPGSSGGSSSGGRSRGELRK